MDLLRGRGWAITRKDRQEGAISNQDLFVSVFLPEATIVPSEDKHTRHGEQLLKAVELQHGCRVDVLNGESVPDLVVNLAQCGNSNRQLTVCDNTLS